MSLPLKILLALGLLALTAYGAVLGWLWAKQESLLFFPDKLALDQPISREADVYELQVPVDGAQLSVLQLRLPNPKGVVFFLHGNGGSLATWFINTELYRRANFDLVMMDYRGYGKSTGRISSEAQMHADVRAVWAAVAPQYQGKRLVVYGRSLGTGLAAQFAADLAKPPDLTVLVSPYRSMVAMTGEIYPFVPSLLLRYPLRTDQALARLASPLLLVHGERDEVIPCSHAQALHALKPDAKLLLLPTAGHNDVHEFPIYRSTIDAALAAL